MGKRSAGLLMLLTVALFLVGGPGIGGRRIAGHPAPIDLPGPPQVGECMPMPSAKTAPSRFARFDRCDDDVMLGEVVAVETRSLGVSNPPPERVCRTAGAAYAGLFDPSIGPAAGGESMIPFAERNAATGPHWSYPFEPTAEWIAQMPRSSAEFSSWFACLVRPMTAWQRGSLADAFAGGRLPAAYGRCWVATTPRQGNAMVACSWPHNAELLGVDTTVGGPEAEPARLQQSCEDLASRLLGRADPTVGGELSLRVGQGDPMGPTAQEAVFCYAGVTDGRLIEGSLIGLKSSPIRYLS